VRQRSLSCGLPGSIHIDDQPVLSLTIPYTTRRGGERGLCHQILLKEEPECFDAWLIKGSEKTTERAMTGKVGAAKERHEGGSKGPETLIKRFQGGFSTHRVSNEDHNKVNRVVVTKSGAGKPHTLLDGIQNAILREHMSKNGYFTKP
jgi:hypothetical protein